MSHHLHRILGSIYNTPHLILSEALQPIINYLDARNSAGISFEVAEAAPDKPAESQIVGGVGEIKVDGTLTYRPVYGMCGPTGTSYQGILAQCQQLIDSGVTTIILTHSSPGGQAQMAFDCATSLREMCDESSVKLISYVETMSASASYLIACVSDEVVCHPEAVVGSIGAMIAIVDRSKALSEAGIRPIYLSSTPGKIPFDKDGAFTEKFLGKMQDEVTLLGTQFAKHVSINTGIPVDSLLALDAEMFHAEEAKSIGLVNSVMNHKQFSAYIATLQGASNA